MKFISNNQARAFSLIEIMVIISIILVGMIGVMSLLLQNIKAQTINKNRFIAYQMAQEGIEIVRATRDIFAVNGLHIQTEFPSNAQYVYSYESSLSPYIGSPNEMKVCIDGNGFYNDYHHCPDIDNPNTIFSRIIEFQDGNDGTNNFLLVLSKVYWTERGTDYSYTLETHLYDWY